MYKKSLLKSTSYIFKLRNLTLKTPLRSNSSIFNFSFLIFNLFFLFLSTIPSSAYALPTPQNLAVYTADQAECNQTEHICTYLGNVNFDQGETHLDAPKVLVYRDESNTIQKIVAIGTPARYRSIKENTEKDPINAKANTIELYPVKNLVFLIGAAEIDEKQNKFTSEHIIYDTKQHTISSSASENSLAKIIYNPQVKK